MNWKIYLLAIATILFLVSGCGVNLLIPDMLLVKRAISLEITLNSTQLNQELLKSTTDAPKFEINRVIISEIEALAIENLPSYRIIGTYDLTIELPKRRLRQQQNPFQLYLQRQPEGKTWRLARSQSAGKNTQFSLRQPKPTWVTYLIR